MAITRRRFLARSAAVGAVAGFSGFRGMHAHAAEPLVKGTPQAEKLGWRVGFSAYSFRNDTVMGALEKMAAVGLRYTELFAWQKYSADHPDAKPDSNLSKPLQRDLKNKASDLGVSMLGIYSSLGNVEQAKAMFGFAAEMGFEFIVSEPPEAMFDSIDKLAQEYKIDLALHNHPQPSHYWNPDVGQAALEGCSSRMGFCCDTGHWCRSNLEPVAMLRKIGPRVKTFHMKDLDRFGVREAKDVIWGQGKGRIAGILEEVHRQDIEKPYFGIEWERDPNEPLETHARSVAFFEEVAGRLAASS